MEASSGKIREQMDKRSTLEGKGVEGAVEAGEGAVFA